MLGILFLLPLQNIQNDIHNLYLFFMVDYLWQSGDNEIDSFYHICVYLFRNKIILGNLNYLPNDNIYFFHTYS